MAEALRGRIGLRLADVIALCLLTAVLGALALVGLPSCTHPHAFQGDCMNKLGQIGKASLLWAVGHRQTWPDAFTGESTRWDDVGGTRVDEYDPVNATQKPDMAQEAGDNKEPVNSNTAGLWRLVVTGVTPDVFICPSASAHVGHLADFTAPEATRSRLRDFRGETFCSYSYQNVLGDYRLRAGAAHATTLAVAADANPMRRDFWSGAPGGGVQRGITDAQLARGSKFPSSPVTKPWNRQIERITHPWELNSPNHDFRGQSVLYLDGHVEWQAHPYCGPRWDNIWLRRKAGVAVEVAPARLDTLRAYNDESSYDGTSMLPADSADDSFLVP